MFAVGGSAMKIDEIYMLAYCFGLKLIELGLHSRSVDVNGMHGYVVQRYSYRENSFDQYDIFIT